MIERVDRNRNERPFKRPERAVFAIGVFCSLGLILPVQATSPAHPNGRIESINTCKVVRVWGSPQQMGQAHGALMSTEIVRTIDAIIGGEYGNDITAYERLGSSIEQLIEFPPNADTEIRAIYEGIVKTLGQAPRVDALNRPIKAEDLLVLNAMDVLRAFGCSGFTVWGEKAGDAGVITARNFDYTAFSRDVVAGQIILVRHPDNAHAAATVTFPGYIGAFTGISDAGVCTFMHDGTGSQSPQPQRKYVPTALVAKELLEQADASDAIAKARALLEQSPTAFSYLFRVVTPFDTATNHATAHASPATVFRIDADGVGANPIHTFCSITTNHYLTAAFGPPDKAWSDSIRRYDTLDRAVDGTVTSDAAWAALRAVAAGDQQGSYVSGTLHSVVVFPNRRRLEIAFAKWQERFTPAPMNPPVSINFDDLFKAP